MAVDPEASSLSPPFLAGALATIGAAAAAIVALATAAAVVFRAITKVGRDAFAQIEDVRKSAEAGDQALWKDRMNGDREANDVRIDAERHFSTKGDITEVRREVAELRSAIADLQKSVEARFSEDEARTRATVNSALQQIQAMISGRGPVTARGAGE